MSDTEYQTNLDDQDRLPWLEAVESDDDQEGMSASKLLGFVLAALLALLVVIGGVWWLRSQKAPADGDGQLITAQEGDYKVKANDDDGLKVEGQGDATFAASEGAEANGTVAAAAQAEAPVEGVKAPATATAPATAAKPVVTATVPAAPAGKITPPPSAVGGTPIQLGAFGSQASADQAWAKLAARHKVLAGMAKTVEAGQSGGKTVYRLRASASSPAAAASACSAIKAAGGSCLLP